MSVNRSDAATTLFLWQFQGERVLVSAASSHGGNGSLSSLVESLACSHPPRPHQPAPPPRIDFLALDEERAIAGLREQLRGLASTLRPEEVQAWEARLGGGGLIPRSQIASLRRDLDRLGAAGRTRQALRQDLEAIVVTSAPPPQPPEKPARAILLFSRDGRLLGSEGDADTLDLLSLAALVARADPGSTWTLAHRGGTVVGHLGQRAALVALFAQPPKANVGETLRASLASLERRESFLNAPGAPKNHDALIAYVRTIRALLQKNA